MKTYEQDTIWLVCACGSEVLSAHADPTFQGQQVELAIWYNGKWSQRWRERLRRAWAALRGKDLWHDQTILRDESARALAAWLLEHTTQETPQ